MVCGSLRGGQLFVIAGFILMLGALVAHRVSRKSLRMRSIEEEPKDSEKKGNEMRLKRHRRKEKTLMRLSEE